MNKRYFDVVYLGLQPVSGKSEGLNVLLCDTIKPLINSKINVAIHTTNRHKKAIEDALIGNSVDLSLIEINSYSVGSAVIPFLTSRSKRRNNSRNFFEGYLGKLIFRFSKYPLFLSKEFILWVLDASIHTLPFKMMAALVLFLGLAPVFLLIFALILLLIIPVLIIGYFKHFLNRNFLRARNNSRVYKLLKPVAKWLLKNFVSELSHVLYEREQVRFIHAVSRNKRIKKLFFFTCFEGAAIKQFKGKSLVVFPDVVTAVFPIRFKGYHHDYVLESIKKSVIYSDGLICYSDYVKEKQLKKVFSSEVKNKTVTVIPQGYFLPEVGSGSESVLSAFNKDLLNQHGKYLKNLFPDLLKIHQHVDFKNFSYILYPTVDRPHKNTLTLVRAFSILLRKKYRNIKLVLTTPALTGEVAEYIRLNRLHYDILIMPSVPLNVLDDLFRGASMMVHPSLAEGGDIFNFSRAVSVGCPALMSDIPVVREMFDRKKIDPKIYKDWIFDPFDHEKLAEIIDKSMSNPNDMIESQIQTLKELSVYGYTEMSQRYLETFEGL